ncbi:MAG: F0F1 ATP synthase subunit delta [Rhodospirillaceae bacterium]|nr:F0F1 ATP synthase subunit delta [Rhodospirillaceae bacterium]
MAAQSTVSAGLASRYATALFDLADDSKALDTVAQDLATIRSMLADSVELRRLVTSPLLSREDQARAMDAVLAKAGLSDLTRRFVGVVVANRRLFALGAMITAFLEELARRRGEVTASVRVARALDDTQMAALTDQLKRAVGAKVSIDLEVDPSLLGGMVVKVGSRLVDSSLRTKLDKLQLAMKGIA